MDLADKIESYIAQMLDEEKLFLVDIKQSVTGKIQVFVDGEKNITIDQCARLSRHIESLLDESGLVPENYVLEVSSPGMFNPLKVLKQYQKRIGSVLNVVTLSGENLEGKLIAVDTEKISLLKEEKKKKKQKKQEPVQEEPEPLIINFENIKKATVQFKF